MDPQQGQQQAPQETSQNNDDDAETTPRSRYVIVRGIRYVVPYLKKRQYSVRLQNAGKPVSQVLALALNRTHHDLAETNDYFRREVVQGRILLKRSKSSREDDGPFTRTFQTVLDPDMPTKRNDLLQILQHIHERCTIYRGPLLTIPMTTSPSFPPNGDAYQAVFKPAGLPVVNDGGDCYGSVTGLVRDDGYALGHRLDLPVAGVLLLGKGKRAQNILKALDAKGKQQHGFLKAYLARVKGGENLSEEMQDVQRRLKWDNRDKKALVVDADEKEEKARDTITRVQRLKWDPTTGESLLRVELITGARQQVRAVLASMGLPIIGDVKYGGGEPQEAPPESGEEKLRIYADDQEGTLLALLSREHVDWCDKCRWQTAETKKGGTRRGAEQLAAFICLLSYHYRVPSLGIDAKLPDELMPDWAT